MGSETENERPVKITFTLVSSVFVCVFGTSFSYGFNIGVVNTPAPLIRAFYNATYAERRGGDPLDHDTNTLLWTVTVALFVATGMVGAFASGKMTDMWGRRLTIILISFVMLIAAVLGGITKVTKAPECLIASRVFIGLHNGVGMSLCSLYLNEVAPKKIRGAIGVCNQLFITVGILTSQVLGLRQIFGSMDLWFVLFAFNAVPAVVTLIFFPLCPESPRFLLINRNKVAEATTALQRLRGYDNVDDELEEMHTEAKMSQTTEAFTLKKLLTTPELRLPIVIAVILFVVQSWSGINAVFSYSVFIFKQAQIPDDTIQYLIVGTGCINVAVTIVCAPLMEKAGRRILLLSANVIMVISYIFLTVFIKLVTEIPEHSSKFAIVCIVAMHTYIIGFAIGCGPIPFLIVGELFRQAPRAMATGFALVFQWVTNFILLLTFPFLQEALGTYTYLIFAGILIAAFIFEFIFVPETKNRTFEDIALTLSSGRRQTMTLNITDASETIPMHTSKE